MKTAPDSKGPKGMAPADPKLMRMLEENWRSEKEGAATYRALAESESDQRRRKILNQLAEAEERHAERLAGRLEELGGSIAGQVPATANDEVIRLSQERGLSHAIEHLENEEEVDTAKYRDQAVEFNDAPSQQILSDLMREEQSHARVLRSLAGKAPSESRGGPHYVPPTRDVLKGRLDRILGRERWHARTGSWLGDAIYGVNDGLGAIFGLVSGVAGATAETGATNIVLISGLVGMVASALSMGSGAYLATKSNREVHDAEIARERNEMEENIDEEREELELFYQLKGFSQDEAHRIVEKLARNPEEMLQVMAQEELGITIEKLPRPFISASSAALSTAVGAFIPILPFFFLRGVPAIIAAAVISLIAHFAVGAAKTIITNRSWFASGMEMTVVGAIEGAVTFVLGFFLKGFA